MKIEWETKAAETKLESKRCAMYGALFVLSLLTVFRVVPYEITLGITVVVILLLDRNILRKVDYSLLLTFVFLFVFIGNLGNMPGVSTFLKNIVTGNEVAAGILASQVFSNVPAALLLSGFTPNAKGLLIGVNLGGLGTLIASMASLISFKFLVKEKVRMGNYLLVFTLLNLLFLAFNVGLWLLIG